MEFYLAKDGKQTGPFSEEQVKSMLGSGLLTGSELCWHEGLPNWAPLFQVLPGVPAAPPLSPASFPLSESHSGQHPGFWWRFLAHLIDTIVMYVVGFAIGFMVGLVMGLSDIREPGLLRGFGGLMGFVAGWLYYALLESGPRQATVGKMACGMIVTDLNGQRVSFGRATGRYFGMIVSTLTFFIGFMMCAWTSRKQCLHDMMAGCLLFKE